VSDAVLLIEHGAIETRAALIRNGAVSRLWFGPALGGERNDFAPRPGRRFIGKINSVNRGLNAAFVDIGAEENGFLPLKTAWADAIVEGALVEVRIVAPPRQSKGARLDYVGLAAGGSEVGRAAPIASPVVEAAGAIGQNNAEIVVDCPVALSALARQNISANLSEDKGASSLFDAYNVDEAVSDALASEIALPGGGRLVFSETEALVAIDVDTHALDASSNDRLREKVIITASAEAVRQIALRNLGGRIAIDFPSIKSRAARERAAGAIEQNLAALTDVSSISLSRGNFLILTRDRRGPTLWEEWTEAVRLDPVPGRRFTLEWLAREAVRTVERRQKAFPSVKLEICAGADMYRYLTETARAAERYFSRFGARLSITRTDHADQRHFEIVER
jgi:Ribonuclease G/E